MRRRGKIPHSKMHVWHTLPLVGYYCYDERAWLCLDLFYIAKLIHLSNISGNFVKYREHCENALK